MSAFDSQVEKTKAPKDMSLNDVLQFVRDVYSFTIPEGKEPGESAFNVLDYYQMEEIGAYLKALQVELARKDAELEVFKKLYTTVCANIQEFIHEDNRVKARGGENVDELLIEYTRGLEQRLAALSAAERGGGE